MSVKEIVEKNNTVTPTILRLCKKLGFKSYKDLQQHIINFLIKSKESNEGNIYINSIHSLFNINDAKDIKKFQKQIFKYKKVYIYAMGYSAIVATYFERLLSRVGNNVITLHCCNTHLDEIN